MRGEVVDLEAARRARRSPRARPSADRSALLVRISVALPQLPDDVLRVVDALVSTQGVDPRGA